MTEGRQGIYKMDKVVAQQKSQIAEDDDAKVMFVLGIYSSPLISARRGGGGGKGNKKKKFKI